jgi:hypothetical protein
MVQLQWIKIREHERGLLFKDRVFQRILQPGRHLIVDPTWRTRTDRVSTRDPWLRHPDLEVIARSGALAGEAQVLDLEQHERALVWVNGRFEAICGPGLWALWTVFHKVSVEIVDARTGMKPSSMRVASASAMGKLTTLGTGLRSGGSGSS